MKESLNIHQMRLWHDIKHDVLLPAPENLMHIPFKSSKCHMTITLSEQRADKRQYGERTREMGIFYVPVRDYSVKFLRQDEVRHKHVCIHTSTVAEHSWAFGAFL